MIITKDEVKAVLKTTSTTDDALLDEVVKRAQAYFETATGRKFERDTFTQKFLGEGQTEVFLKNYPVAFTDFSTTNFVKIGDTKQDEDNLYVEEDTGRVVLLASKFSNKVACEVKYLGGFASGLVPEDVKQAIIEIAVSFYHKTASQGVSSQSMGDISEAYFKDTLNDSARRIIDLYRSVNV